MKIIPISFPDAWTEITETSEFLVITDFCGTVSFPLKMKNEIMAELDNHFQALQKMRELMAR